MGTIDLYLSWGIIYAYALLTIMLLTAFVFNKERLLGWTVYILVPAFVVRAAREEQAKVAQDTRLSPSTRKHVLAELKTLEEAFETSP